MNNAVQKSPAAAGMRDRILDATERLLARYGYQKTTMDDLAREAGISKRTIYLHFTNKEEVALSSIDRIVARLTDRLREIAGDGRPAAERLRDMLIERVLYRFDAVRDYYQSLDDLFASLRPAYMARRSRYFDEEARILARVLKDGKRSGELAGDDLERTAHAMLLATNSLLPSSLTARELGKREEVKQRALKVAELLLSGVRRRGR
jgi:AcrR family transcriptional regulator